MAIPTTGLIGRYFGPGSTYGASTSVADVARSDAGPFSDSDYFSATAISFNSTSTAIRVAFTLDSGGTTQTILSQGFIRPFRIQISSGNDLQITYRNSSDATVNETIGALTVGNSYDLTIDLKSTADEIVVTDHLTGALSGTIAADFHDSPTVSGTFYIGRYASTGLSLDGSRVASVVYTLNGTPTHAWDFSLGLADTVGAKALSETGDVPKPNTGTLNGGDTLSDLYVGAGNGPGGNLANHGVVLDSSADYVTLPNLGISGTQARTLAAWVKPVSAADAPVLYFGNKTNGQKFSLRASSGFLRVEIEGGGYTSSLAVQSGVWQLVAVTFSGSTLADCTLYVNGDSEAASGANALNTANTNWGIGVNNLGSGSPTLINGSIADALVYNRVLSPSEIAQLYAEGAQIEDLNVTGPAAVQATGPAASLRVARQLIQTAPAAVTASGLAAALEYSGPQVIHSEAVRIVYPPSNTRVVTPPSNTLVVTPP